MRSRMLRTFGHFLESTVHTSVGKLQAFTKNCHFGCVSQIISASGNDARSPLTAGNACTMSPREPRRTTRNLGSLMCRLAKRFQQSARGVFFRVTTNRTTNTQTVGDSLFRNGRTGIVGSFGMYVRPQFVQERFHIRL